MTDRLLVDLGPDGRVSVGTWLEDEGEIPESGEPCELAWPLDAQALEDLRWYLEDYLRLPYAVYEDRGHEVESALTAWGRAVFAAVFGAGPGRDAYLRVRARGTPELVFRSSSPELLGLPWELMADPAMPTPLAINLAGVSRRIPVGDSAQTVPVPRGRLRVLMAISRPAGEGDVGYRMIARPLLERLEAVRGQVDLVVLRPPTLDALRAALAEAAQAGKPFQVVHFDGHGALAGPEGVLVFERPEGGPQEVPASRVAQVLAAANVPVVVLNACQSGAVGKDLEAAVATRLLRAGAASVVAMAYIVHAEAAAKFMAEFYERLFAGDTVTAAVTAGRQGLYLHNERPSPKGELPLSDWLVPVHYLRRDVSFPQARIERPAGLPPLAQMLARHRAATGDGTGDLDAEGSFVGRDSLFFQLEAAARQQKVVVLHGPGGTGKTELAKAFGAWWRDTGGVDDPGWVFWHSFEPGVAAFSLGDVLGRIGRQLYGDAFDQEDPDMLAALEGLLTERRMLLIWDNFESVRSMPDPGRATEPLDQAGSEELRGFLARLAARQGSAVLITSRSDEDWLGGARRMAVGGLAAHEAIEYAGQLLAPYPSTLTHRQTRAFGELMEWLDGHPLSMRLILPRLDAADPAALLAGLRGTAPMPGGDDAGTGRTTSLSASVGYSFAHLAEGTRRLLPAVCLCHAVADTDVLAAFSAAPQTPLRFRGASGQDWRAALADAARVGLLSDLGAGRYRIHPALPGYLAAWWRGEDQGDHGAAREAATTALLSAHAILGDWLSEQIAAGDAALALGIIALEYRTIGSLLGYALAHGLWPEALRVADPLRGYWEARGLHEEARAWIDRVRLATERDDGTPPALDTPAGELWVFFVGYQADKAHARHHFDEADRVARQILAMLRAQAPSALRRRFLASNYHQLGLIAAGRGLLDEADKWYRKSLSITEAYAYGPGMARTYHQLGTITHTAGQLDQADQWYRKALAIKERLGDKPGMASSSQGLGLVARDRGRFEDAERWYRKALAIAEELDDQPLMIDTCSGLGRLEQERWQREDADERLEEAAQWYRRALGVVEELADKPRMASVYGGLGNIAFLGEHPDEAEQWYRRAMAIENSLGDTRGLAGSYHQLGLIADHRGRLSDDQGQLDQAADWYRRSLALMEETDDVPGAARVLGQLSWLAEDYGEPEEAMEWMVRCVALFDEFPHPITGTVPEHPARLTAELGPTALEACWQRVAGTPLPPAVRRYVEGNAPL